MKRTIEPFWWSLFGAGGTLAALFIPITLFINGLAIPLGWMAAPDYENVLQMARHPLVKAYLFLLISLSFYHWAHRFRFTLYDGLQLKHLNLLIAVICYGGATVGTVAAAYTLINL